MDDVMKRIEQMTLDERNYKDAKQKETIKSIRLASLVGISGIVLSIILYCL